MIYMYDKQAIINHADDILRRHPTGQCSILDGNNYVLKDGTRVTQKKSRGTVAAMTLKDGISTAIEHGTPHSGMVVFDPEAAIKAGGHGRSH